MKNFKESDITKEGLEFEYNGFNVIVKLQENKFKPFYWEVIDANTNRVANGVCATIATVKNSIIRFTKGKV